MKTSTRKTRLQPSLASLTTDEYHQLADMLRATRTYEDIRQQIAKPRSEGGFDLHISIKPLQVLRDRVTHLDRINQHIATGQKLTLTAFDELQASDTPPAEEVHNAILRATHHRVLEYDNTPHQLLALQRLADFPARAEIRTNREQRAEEMHAHRIEMNHFRQHTATRRLALAERALNLRESLALPRLNPNLTLNPNPSENTEADLSTLNPQLSTGYEGDDIPFLGPCPLPPEVIAENKRYAEKLRTGKIILDFSGDGVREIHVPDGATAPSLSNVAADVRRLTTSCDTQNPNPQPSADATPPAAAPNHTGGGTSPARSASFLTVLAFGSPTSTSRDDINETTAAPADKNTNSSTPPTAENLSTPVREAHKRSTVMACPQLSTKHNPSSPKNSSFLIHNSEFPSPSAPSASALTPADPTHDSSLITHDLKDRVDRYTIRRAQEHIAWQNRYTPWPHKHSPPPYLTEFRHCPCGNQCPCPTHESEEFGPFPEKFWRISPFNLDYAAILRDRNLPFRFPQEYVA